MSRTTVRQMSAISRMIEMNLRELIGEPKRREPLKHVNGVLN